MSCNPITISFNKLLHITFERLMNNNNFLRIFFTYSYVKWLNIIFGMSFFGFFTIKYYNTFIESTFNLKVKTEVKEQDIKKEIFAPNSRSNVNQPNQPIAASESATCLFLWITSSSFKTAVIFHSTPNFALQIPKCSDIAR